MVGDLNSPSKSCGDCGLCCKLMGVTALDKAAGKWCRHFSKAGGCAVYDQRPGDCRVFNCLWLLTDALGPEWKPSVAGFVLHSEDGGTRLVVESDPGRRGVRLGETDGPVRRV